jgi:hypothetical protein
MTAKYIQVSIRIRFVATCVLHVVGALVCLGALAVPTTVVKAAGAHSVVHTSVPNGLSQLERTQRPANRRVEQQLYSRGAVSPPVVRPSDVYTNSWTNFFPSLYDVSAVSATEAWASAEYGHLLRFTNGTWTTMDPPNLRGYELFDVEMVSATSGWIAAETKAFQYDGTTWHDQSNGLEELSWIEGVAPLSDNDVWGIGGDVLLHWNGITWSRAGPILSDTVNLVDIAMRSANDGWAVGSDYNPTGPDAGVLLHYDGTTWTRVPEPTQVISFERVAMGSPGECWLIADRGFGPSWLFRYNNGTWTEWSLGYLGYADIFMLGSTEGWASTGDGSIVHWDGTNWTLEYENGLPPISVESLSGVAGQVWGVGGNDLVLSRSSAKGAGTGDNTLANWVKQHGGPTSNDLYAVSAVSVEDAWAAGDNGIFLHYAGGNWQAVPGPDTGPIWDLQMLSVNEGYAVGTATDKSGEGVIVRWDGSAWTLAAITPQGLDSVYMVGSGEGWAVGAFGSIWHASSGIWKQATSPTSVSLNAVAMDSPQHGWAAGEGVLLEYTGTSWIDRTGSLPDDAPAVEDIALTPDGREGWAVGLSQTYPSEHAIMHLSDGVWTLDPVVTHAYLTRVAVDALGEIWTVGCSAAYHYTEGAWHAQDLPAFGSCPYGLAVISGMGGWAVGSSGSIFRYNPLAPGQRYFDVPTSSPFYPYIECMAGRSIIGGYLDNTFRPNAEVTRGQLSKIVSNSAGFNEDPGPQIFEDVPPGSTFYDWVQRLATRGYIGGYPCGGEVESCGHDNLPYFRPNGTATRGQISKIVSNAAGYSDTSPDQTFEDVPPSNPFYLWIERLASRGIMSGYPCGGEGEPCWPGSKPYFRWGSNATRGQTSKIVANTFFPNCQTPARP